MHVVGAAGNAAVEGCVVGWCEARVEIEQNPLARIRAHDLFLVVRKVEKCTCNLIGRSLKCQGANFEVPNPTVCF